MNSSPKTVRLDLVAHVSIRDREWALLLPAYSVVLIMLTYFVYWALAISATPSFSDMATIVGTGVVPFEIHLANT